MKEDLPTVTSLWDLYQKGVSYQASIGLTKNIPQFVRFYQGDQWAKPTKNTMNLPRPVINIVKMICRNKKSAILSSPVRIVYRAYSRDADVTRFNRFSDYIQRELGQDDLDKKAVGDGVIKGTYVYHYYWDAEARGKDGIKEGALRCETIDPLRIFFSDPTQPDEQKQKWILIASREDIDSVRAKCDRDIDPELIRPDDDPDNKYATAEQEGDRLVTVLTRYFRRNGSVFCEKATRNTVVNKPFSISPDVASASQRIARDSLHASSDFGLPGGSALGNTVGSASGKAVGSASGKAVGSAPGKTVGSAPGKTVGSDSDAAEDAPNSSLPDSGNADALPVSPSAYLYPVVVGNYERRENSIYGLGEVEGILPNQKAINFYIAMMLLNAQETAWGKYIVAPGALREQSISNEPGQVLVDYTNTGNGIKRLSEHPSGSQPAQIIDTIINLTRSVTGSSEVMTGETIGANMSGAAIAQLQSQAQMPIEDLRDSFWLVKEKQGKVLAQFFRLYYCEKEFFYQDDISASQRTAPDIQNSLSPYLGADASSPGPQSPLSAQPGALGSDPGFYRDVFNSSDYAAFDFDVVVESTAGTRASAAGDINALDVLLTKGLISLETYLDAYPDNALSNRSEILRGVQRDQQSQLAQLTQKVTEYEQRLQQYAQALQSQEQTVDRVTSVIRENSQLKALIAQLYTESSSKLSEANRQIAIANDSVRETSADARFFADVLAGNIPVSPPEASPVSP